MNSILPESSGLEKHQSLKRKEREAQRAAWRRRGAEEEAPPLPCRWKAAPAAACELRPAFLLAMFAGDFALVRYLRAEGDSGLRLLRAGVPWDSALAMILRAYVAGAPVPPPFRLRKRLPPAWAARAQKWPPPLQAAWFGRLREGGLLPALPKLDAAATAPWLPWEEVRGRFLDFRGGEGTEKSLATDVTDSPPLRW
jgi:hypothetical protein